MDIIAKVVKAMFFNEDEIDMKFVSKCKYVVYGIILGFILTIAGLCCLE